MPEQVRIKYTKRLTQKIGDDFDTSEVGGEWEFSIPDGGDIQQEYERGYVVLRRIIDDRFDGSHVMPPRALPGESLAKEKAAREETGRGTTSLTLAGDEEPETMEESGINREYHTFPPRSTLDDIIIGQPVFLERVRVWEVNDKQDKAGKRDVTVRVGNRDRIPTGYARIRARENDVSFEIIDKLAGLQEGDFVNVWGHYETWKGQGDALQWDFIPSRVERRK